jgi:hypothetical protein
MHRADTPASTLTQHVQSDTRHGGRPPRPHLGGQQVEDQRMLDISIAGSALTTLTRARSISAPVASPRMGDSVRWWPPYG